MRIAILVTTFPPYHGGMGRVAETQARLLAELGHEVTVFAARGEAEQSAAYRFRRLRPLFFIGNGAFVPELFWRLKNFDAVILHYPAFGFLEAIFFWRFTFGRKKRFFVFYHMDPIASGIKGAIFKFLTSLAGIPTLKVADKILVSSLDYARSGEIGKMADSIKQKLIELPLAVDTDFFCPGNCTYELREHEANTRPDLSKGGPTSGEPLASGKRFRFAEKNILFVGGMDRAHAFKGIPILLEAFAQIKDDSLRLHLVGFGELKSDYERQAVALGLGERVIFHGALDRNDLRDLYCCSDLTVLPSINRSEAFGLVLLESCSCGTPVIASDLPGVRTVVKAGETGWLVVPGDPAALASALTEALRDRERLRAFGAAGRQRVLRYFSTESHKSVLTKLLSL